MLIEIFGLVFSIILGTLGHFLYEWSNYNSFFGFLFSKNESTWEHIKLGITPILLWTIIEFFTFKFSNLFFAKFISIITFIISIIILYYGFKLLVKKNIIFIDIMIFYISLAISYIVSIYLLKFYYGFILNLVGFIGLCFIIYLYKKFNSNTPNCFIFKEPT